MSNELQQARMALDRVRELERNVYTALKQPIDGYHGLHDRLSDMIEGGRLTRDMIPKDYDWLVETLAGLAG